MQIGRRGLVLLVAIGLNACGGLGNPPAEDTPTSLTSGTSTPAGAGDPITTITLDSGTTSAGNSSSTTVVTQATTTTNLVVPPVSTTQATSGQYDPALQPYVDQAIEDLADHLGTEPSSITVTSAEAVVWPDGSLGCPEPGMVYTQAQVDGLLIRLSADGIEYRYHSGGRISTPFLCLNPK